MEKEAGRQKNWPNGLKLPKNLNRRWRNRSRFIMDMASADHKFYFSDGGGDHRVIALTEQLITVIHSLPGYFICLPLIFSNVGPFMEVKHGGKSFHVQGMENVIKYINVVAGSMLRHKISFDDVRAVCKILRVDPAFNNFRIKESEENNDEQ